MLPSSRPFLFSVLALAFLLVIGAFLTGCDSTSTDGHVFADSGIRSSTFQVRFADFEINESGDIATYERQASQLSQRVVDDGVVLLYASGDLIFVGGGAANTWTALPYTQGIEAVQDGVPYVDFTITYSYSFGVNSLFIDVVSSAPDVLDSYIPSRVDFRLVTIPGDVARSTAVDLSDYEAVNRAFGLDR